MAFNALPVFLDIPGTEPLALVMLTHLADLGLRLDIAAAAEADAPPELRLTAMVAALLTGIQADRQAHGLLSRDIGRLPAARRNDVKQRRRCLALSLAEPLRSAAPALRQRPQEAQVLAMSLFAMASASAAWFRPDGVVDVAAYARTLARMTLAAALDSGTADDA